MGAKAGVSQRERGAQREQVSNRNWEHAGDAAADEMPSKAEKGGEISWLLLSSCPPFFQHLLPLGEPSQTPVSKGPWEL